MSRGRARDYVRSLAICKFQSRDKMAANEQQKKPRKKQQDHNQSGNEVHHRRLSSSSSNHSSHSSRRLSSPPPPRDTHPPADPLPVYPLPSTNPHHQFTIGSMVCVDMQKGQPLYGVIKWIGTVTDFPGTIAGVELVST